MSFADCRILVVGAGLADLAARALPGARIEIAAADSLLPRGTAATPPDLVLIDAGGATPEALADAIVALGRAVAPPPTLLTGDHLPAALVRALMRLPRSDVLEAPFTADDLAAAVASLTRPHLPQAHAAPARCWSVMGAVGGAGATTIAIEIACALAERIPGPRRVCLIDLNLADGAAAAYLGAQANMLPARASQAPERIDASLLDAFVSQAAGGIDLLASARDPHAFDLTSTDAVLRILETACQVYDAVVVDAPRHRRPWTMDVLSGSDELLVVSELTVPALLAARALAAEFEAELPEGPPPRIVLNRLAKRMFGPAPSMTEAEKALQRRAVGGVTSDWEAAAASANLGGPISQHRPKSRIVKDVGDLVDRLLASPAERGGAPAEARVA
ncbi:MAG: AAA family ATPase [Pseudomonadota bacterium]